MAVHERDQVRQFLADVIGRSPATETVLALSAAQTRQLRFRDGDILSHGSTRHFRLDAQLAFRRSGRWRVGRSSTTDLSPEGIDRLFEIALALAEANPTVEPYREQPYAEDYESALVDDPGGYDPATAAAGPALCTSEVAEIVLPCRRLGYAQEGLYSLAEGPVASGGQPDIAAVANHNDLFQYFRPTSARVRATISTPAGGIGVLSRRTSRASALDLPSHFRAAIADAERPRRGTPTAGRTRVVLGAEALAQLLDGFAPHLSQWAADQGLALFRPGERWFRAPINLSVAPAHPLLLARPFDAEGWPRRTVPLIADGTVLELLKTRPQSARRESPHGYRTIDSAVDQAVAQHLVLEGGDASLDDLIGQAGDALLIRRLHRAPRFAAGTLDAIGYQPYDAFAVEGGAITASLAPFRYAINLTDLLNAVTAWGLAEAGARNVAPCVISEDFRVV